jgi:hypothetical protein
MKVLSYSSDEEFPAAFFGVWKAFTLDSWPDVVHDSINVFSLEEISDLTRGKEIINVHKESLVSDLSFSEEEHHSFVLDSSLHVHCLQISFKICDTISRGNHNSSCSECTNERCHS